MLKAEEIVFPRENHINWSSNTILEQVHTSNIMRAEQDAFIYLGTCIIYMNIYKFLNKYTHTNIIKEKDHEFDSKGWGGTWEVLGEKREVGGMIFYYNCKNQKVIIKKVRKLAQVVTFGAER